MSAQKILEIALGRSVDEWEKDFDFDIEEEDIENDTHYFAINISHSIYQDVSHDISASVDRHGVSRMLLEDNNWALLNQENLFTWMWFDRVRNG